MSIDPATAVRRARDKAEPPAAAKAVFTPEQIALVQAIVDKAIAAYAARSGSVPPAPPAVTAPPPATTPPVAGPQPATAPSTHDQAIETSGIRAVWYQPAKPTAGASFADWKALGVNTLLGYEPQARDGTAAVSMAEWDAAAKDAGLYRIRTTDDPAADANDAGLLGFQQPDDLDAAVIVAFDAVRAATNDADRQKAAAALEAIYVSAEQFYARCKEGAPGKPVYMDFDGHQVRFHGIDGKVDYPRLLRCCDKASIDWHPIQRGEDISTCGTILDNFRGLPGGHKLCMGLVETSDEELDVRAFSSRAPTADEIRAEARIMRDRRLGWFYFTHRTTGEGKAFLYDNVTPENRAAIKSINSEM